MKLQKKHWGVLIVTVGGFILFGAGYVLGRSNTTAESHITSVQNMTSSTSDTVDFAPFWKTWTILNEKYIPTHSTTTPTDQAKVYGAIEGLTASYGDPYTVFFPPTDNKSFQDQISGSFQGVGMEVDVRDGVLTVVAPLKDTPAYNAGIKAGDKILSINKKLTHGLSNEEAIALIKGPKGTTVVFSVQRDGVKAPFDISVVRDIINVPTIKTETKGNVFIIHLYSFSATSPDLFRGALREFVQSGDTRLILDLRGNPGGYLEAAVDMASWFLPSGKIVVSEKSKNVDENRDYRSRGYDVFNKDLKMAILIDRGSASASEILAGALHEQGVAELIGTRSFGKGSVQELVPITDDTSLKVTIAKWYTPKGNSISDGGLTPDIQSELDTVKFKTGDDTQIDDAVAELDKSDIKVTVNPAGLTPTTATTTVQ